MSEMITRIAKVLELAKANAPFYVMPSQYKNKYNVFEITPPGCVDLCMMALQKQDEAEDCCERLNNEWIARRVIEALKPTTDDIQNEYFKMAKEEGILSCFPNALLERAVDAILKS